MATIGCTIESIPPLARAVAGGDDKLEVFRAMDDEAARMVDIEQTILRMISKALADDEFQQVRDRLAEYREEVQSDDSVDAATRDRLARYCEYQSRRMTACSRKRAVMRERNRRIAHLREDIDFYAQVVADGDMEAVTAQEGIRRRLDAAIAWLREDEAKKLRNEAEDALVIAAVRREIREMNGFGVDEGMLDGLDETDRAALIAYAKECRSRGLLEGALDALKIAYAIDGGGMDYAAAREFVKRSGAQELRLDEALALRLSLRLETMQIFAQRGAEAEREKRRVTLLQTFHAAYDAGDAEEAMRLVEGAGGDFSVEECKMLSRALTAERWQTTPGVMAEGAVHALGGDAVESAILVRVGSTYGVEDAKRLRRLMQDASKPWAPLLIRAIGAIGDALCATDGAEESGRNADAAVRDILTRVDALRPDDARILDVLSPRDGGVAALVASAYGGRVDASACCA